MKTKSMFKMSINYLLSGLTILALSLFFYLKNDAKANNNFGDSELITITNSEYIDAPIAIEDSCLFLHHELVKRQLISEVNSYITKHTKGKAHPDLAEFIVNNALEYDIDICFMMGQTQVETNFGTAGIGRASSKRSLFGVMKRIYKNYNEAVADYCRLLKKSYLTKGRTEHDLMKKYVSSGGHRYAGSTTYEVTLSKTYKSIADRTKITSLQKRYKKSYNEYLTQQIESNDSTVS